MNSLDNIRTIITVIGCQRSGTTLTGQILGAHPNAVLIDEEDDLYDWFHAFSTSASDLTAFHSSTLRKAMNKYQDPSQRFVQHHNGEASLASEITHLVLKAPNLTYDFDTLSKLPFDVRVVYLIRDPRAVVASIGQLKSIPMVENQIRLIQNHSHIAQEFISELTDMRKPETPDHVKRALMWKIKSSLGDKFMSCNLPTLRLRYEDLIADPDASAGKLANHVQLPLHKNMLAYDTVLQGSGPGYTSRSRPVDRTSLNKWRHELTEPQCADIFKAIGDRMQSFGYLNRA